MISNIMTIHLLVYKVQFTLVNRHRIEAAINSTKPTNHEANYTPNTEPLAITL
jgi:hypothetical protein